MKTSLILAAMILAGATSAQAECPLGKGSPAGIMDSTNPPVANPLKTVVKSVAPVTTATTK